ncbi:hypothetical protein MMC10_002084 [Thelotrema lepadinum]|nr:hypothetical protein [Thelotrema lepadinum]
MDIGKAPNETTLEELQRDQEPSSSDSGSESSPWGESLDLQEVQRPREVNPFKNVKPSRKKTLPETEPGLKAIQFYHNDDWEDILEEVGTKTRSISFGDKGESFRLADSHIDDIIAKGRKVCNALWDFEFEWCHKRDGPRSSAEDLSEDAVVRLAQACPNLRRVTLQNTQGLTDRAYTAFFRHCRQLSFLDISTLSNSGCNRPVVGTLFDTLRNNPDWAPKLKTLRVMQDGDAGFMRAMRDLGKERGKLVIQLAEPMELWRDEMDLYAVDYRGGRKRGDMKQVDRWRDERLDPHVWHENWRARRTYGH